jgi:hypothetical protein
VVTVTPPSITMNTSGAVTVGAGLQRVSTFSLGAPGAGVVVRLCSSQPSVAKVSRLSTEVGTDCADIPAPGTTTSLTFYVHGMEGQTGTVTIAATAPGYSDGTGTATIVQPGFRLSSLNGSYAAAATDDLFQVQVGLVSASGTDLDELQIVRAGSPGLTATVTSSNTAAGQLKVGGPSPQAGGTVTAFIGAGQTGTPSSFTTTIAGLAFDAVAAGSTTVTAAIPGYRTTSSSSSGSARTVTVTP